MGSWSVSVQFKLKQMIGNRVFGQKVDDLKDVTELNNLIGITKDIAPMRETKRILIIDNEDVPFKDILANNKYNLTHIPDIEDIFAVENYDLILCDIQGVGVKLSPTFQGAHVVEEIKKHYPFKQVIAFSGYDGSLEKTDSLRHADRFLKKDANERQWIDALDECIQNLVNPIEQWMQVRKYLFQKNISTKNVAILEDLYVKAILSRNKDRYLGKNLKMELPKDVKTIVLNLAANIIYALGQSGIS